MENYKRSAKVFPSWDDSNIYRKRISSTIPKPPLLTLPSTRPVSQPPGSDFRRIRSKTLQTSQSAPLIYKEQRPNTTDPTVNRRRRNDPTRPKSSLGRSSSWRTLTSSTKIKPNPNEIIKLDDKYKNFLSSRNCDWSQKRVLSWEDEVQLLKESDFSCDILLQLARQMATFDRPGLLECSTLVMKIANDNKQYISNLSHSCGEERKIITKLIKEKQALSEKEKSIRKKINSIEIQSKQSGDLQSDQQSTKREVSLLRKRLRSSEKIVLESKNRLKQVQYELEKVIEEKNKYEQEVNSKNEMNLYELFESKNETKYVLIDQISSNYKDREIESIVKPFGGTRITGKFPADIYESRMACICEFDSVESAIQYNRSNMTEYNNHTNEMEPSKWISCFAKEYPTDKLTIRSRIHDTILQDYFYPLGKVINRHITDYHTLLHYDSRKATCSAHIFLKGRQIAWFDENKQEHLAYFDLDFANDTHGIIWKDPYDEMDIEKSIDAKCESCNQLIRDLKLVEKNLKKEKFNETGMMISKEDEQRMCVKEIERRVSEAQRKLVQMKKERDQQETDMQENREKEWEEIKIKLDVKLKKVSTELDQSRKKLQKEEQNHMKLKCDFGTKRSIDRRRLVRNGDEDNDLSQEEYIEILEKQIKKLEKQQKKTRMSLLEDGGNKGSMLKMKLSMKEKEIAGIRNEATQLKCQVERQSRMIEGWKMRCSILENDTDQKRTVKSPVSTEIVENITKQEGDLRVENQELRRELAELTKQGQASDLYSQQELQELEKKRNSIEKQLEESQQQLVKINTDIKEARGLLENYQDQLSTCSKRVEMDLEKLGGRAASPVLDGNKNNLYSLHNELEEKLVDDVIRHQALQGKFDASDCKKDGKIAELEAKIRDLQRQMRDIQNDYDTRIKKMQQQVKQLVSEREEIDQKFKSKEEELEQLKQKSNIDVLCSNLDPNDENSNRKVITELAKERDLMKKKFNELQAEHDDLSSEHKESIEKFNEEIKKLKADNKSLENELQRIAKAADKFDKYQREVAVEEMIENNKRKWNKIARAATPEKSNATDSPGLTGLVGPPLVKVNQGENFITSMDHKKLMKKIKKLEDQNTHLERELEKLRLQSEASIRQPFHTRFQGHGSRMANVVHRVIQNKKPLQIEKAKAPEPKVKREIEGKWKMTKSRFLKITKGSASTRIVKSKKWINRLITEIYDAKSQADEISFRENVPIDNLPEFIYHQFIPSRFGIVALVDTMCWDIHNAVEQYTEDPSNREIQTFKKFLNEDLPLSTLSFYLKARKGVLKKPRSSLNRIHSIHFDSIMDTVFDTATFEYRHKLAEILELRGLLTHGKSELDVHMLLKVLVEEYNHLQIQFKNQALRLFVHMGLHKKEVVRFNDFLPLFRIILAGVPEEKGQSFIERLRMPDAGLMPLAQFEQIIERFSQLRLQFLVVADPSDVSEDLDIESLFAFADLSWRDLEGSLFSDVISTMFSLNLPYTNTHRIRGILGHLKDLGKHLNMALINHFSWESFVTYYRILKLLHSVFDEFELEEVRQNNSVKSARNLVNMVEECLIKRSVPILKRARTLSDSGIHNNPRFEINEHQAPSRQEDILFQKMTLQKFANNMSITVPALQKAHTLFTPTSEPKGLDILRRNSSMTSPETPTWIRRNSQQRKVNSRKKQPTGDRFVHRQKSESLHNHLSNLDNFSHERFQTW